MTTASPVTEREQALGLPLLQRLQDLALVLEAPEGELLLAHLIPVTVATVVVTEQR